MLRSITAKQLRNWEFYDELEPFSEIRDDYRFASIATMIANVHRGKKQKQFKLEDFLLKFGEQEPKRQQTQAEQLRLLTLMARIQAAVVTNENKT